MWKVENELKFTGGTFSINTATEQFCFRWELPRLSREASIARVFGIGRESSGRGS